MAIALAGVAATWSAPAAAGKGPVPQYRDVSLCSDPPYRADAAGLLDWRDTICLEHRDRVMVIERLAAMLPPDERPQLSQVMVPRGLLPPVFDRDVPLLRVVFPERSFFDTASARIRPDAQRLLGLIAAALRAQAPDVAVFVVGHTDNRGGDDYNYNLSVDRALSVTSELYRRDIGSIALWRVGFGELVPLRPNINAENMAVNRRVEFLFAARTEVVATWLEGQDPSPCAASPGSSAASCKLQQARPVVAVAVTRRTGLVVPPPNRTTLRPLPGTGTMAIEQPGRLILRLAPQKRRMAVPTPL